MKTTIKIRLLSFLALLFTVFNAGAVALWVGQSYTWDFSGSIMGSTYNMSVTSDGGYLSITGSGAYRTVTPTQYFSGTATVIAEWDYTLYYGDTKKHKRVTLTVSCNENPVTISPPSVTLSPGETYQLRYSHDYNNEYVGAANAYFSGGNSSFSVTSSGLITAIEPGSGYVNVFSKLSSSANAPYCTVTVREVEPTGASIRNVNILADESKALEVTVSPSNASVKSKQWYIKSGDDVVKISGQLLTGLKPGEATVYCMVNGSVRSNDAIITVSEPELTVKSTFPEKGATDISVFTVPSVTYSHSISEGAGFNSIALESGGKKVEGEVEITDKTIRFLPTKPLSPKTDYHLLISSDAIKNKWGSNAADNFTLSFKTGELEKATVTMTPVSGSFLTKDEAVTLTAFPTDATIYYTTDGSTPSTSSKVYTEPIKENDDFSLKAFAVCEGYENSEIAAGEYFKSQSEIVGYYPNEAEPIFNYAWVCPYLKLSGEVEKSNNFRRISLLDESGKTVPGKAFLSSYIIIFVPDEPLENCMTYTMDIPRDAVKTTNGETFKGFNWTFSTPVMPTDISMRGDESLFILSENGAVSYRGLCYSDATTNDGSYIYKDVDTLTSYAEDVEEIASGYTHNLLRKGSIVQGHGISLCSEGGTPESIEAIGAIKTLRAGFQTSAIIGEDNSLWMCGRNDFYQLADKTGSTSKSYIKVADQVSDVALGNGFTLYVDTDNVLWGVGRNHRGQLGDGTTQNKKEPVKIIDNVLKVFASASGFFSACITTDNTLLTWGDNSMGQLGREADKYSSVPARALDNVVYASLGEKHVLALTENYKVYSWGSNESGQIAKTGSKIEKPEIMAENIRTVDAGPCTSILLANSGKVTGWGKLTHNNFASGNGKASDYIVYEGLPCDSLKGVMIEPYRFEIEPESSFALVAVPIPSYADFDTMEWSSDNPEVAVVEGNGIIHSGSIGQANITVKLTDRFGVSKSAKIAVTCTENPDNSDTSNLNHIDINDWYAYSSDESIIIENARYGATYTIFSLQGLILGETIAYNDRVVFTLNQPGLYLVKSGSKVIKVICN